MIDELLFCFVAQELKKRDLDFIHSVFNLQHKNYVLRKINIILIAWETFYLFTVRIEILLYQRVFISEKSLDILSADNIYHHSIFPPVVLIGR